MVVRASSGAYEAEWSSSPRSTRPSRARTSRCRRGAIPTGPPDNYLDTTRLQADTGFRPEYDVERAVPDYVDWLRGHDR
jgi:nucleoside-diphosphate-sugar epimerase